MKSNITITIDQEIVKMLREETNYSDVINEQMKGYYAVKTCENQEVLRLNLAKTKQILKENRKKRREIEAALLKIDQKHKKIKQSLRKQGLTRSKLIKQIEKRRALEQTSHKRTTYYEDPEAEADRILKGGKKL